MTTMQELVNTLKADTGYGRAVCLPGKVSAEQAVDAMVRESVPVLSMADGPLGVLRAMSVRCGNMAKMVAESGHVWTVAVAKLLDGTPTMQIWSIILHPESGAR